MQNDWKIILTKGNIQLVGITSEELDDAGVELIITGSTLSIQVALPEPTDRKHTPGKELIAVMQEDGSLSWYER